MFASSFWIKCDDRQKRKCQICMQTLNKTLPLIALVSGSIWSATSGPPAKVSGGKTSQIPSSVKSNLTDANIL